LRRKFEVLQAIAIDPKTFGIDRQVNRRFSDPLPPLYSTAF